MIMNIIKYAKYLNSACMRVCVRMSVGLLRLKHDYSHNSKYNNDGTLVYGWICVMCICLHSLEGLFIFMSSAMREMIKNRMSGHIYYTTYLRTSQLAICPMIRSIESCVVFESHDKIFKLLYSKRISASALSARHKFNIMIKILYKSEQTFKYSWF